MNKPLTSKILLVDDDTAVLNVLSELFCDDYEILCASSGEEAIEIVKQDNDIATVVLDIKIPGMDGIATGRAIKNHDSKIPIIFHTGYPGDFSEDDIDASERPFDYVEKGRSATRLIRTVGNAVRAWASSRDTKSLIEVAELEYGLVGRSSLMQKLYADIHNIAPSDNKVMIVGETGTGKELVARAIHKGSRRHNSRLAILNCNHKSPDLIESELFGHTKGAFTGAVADRIGLFEYANGGTVFLDEVGDLDITSQAKLLRVLETDEYQKIGSPDLRKTDARLICATHRDLESMVANNQFREDLYYRLKGIVISNPPLRDRAEDIVLLVKKFSDTYNEKHSVPPCIFDPEAISVFVSHTWPGNVRQLKDAVESILALSNSELIVADDVKSYLDQSINSKTNENGSLSEKLRSIERTLIVEALIETNFNISAAATLLGVERANLSKKVKAYGIDVNTLRSSCHK